MAVAVTMPSFSTPLVESKADKLLSYQLKTRQQIARVRLRINYLDRAEEISHLVFNEDHDIAHCSKPPTVPVDFCSSGEPIDRMSRHELVTTSINDGDFLYTRTSDIYTDGVREIVATCVKHRSRRGSNRYRIDVDGATVEKIR